MAEWLHGEEVTLRELAEHNGHLAKYVIYGKAWFPLDEYAYAVRAARYARRSGEIVLADCPHCGHACVTPAEVVYHDEQALCVGGSERFQS